MVLSRFAFAAFAMVPALALSLALPAQAQEILPRPKPPVPGKPSETQKTAPSNNRGEALAAMRLMLGRAQAVRALAAEHLVYMDSKRDTPEVHLMEEAAQVMAYSLICEDKAMDPKTLNDIANETTLKIALLLQQSPAGQKLLEANAGRPDEERLAMIGDIASAALMFKIGRRRGLFDALMTDFGQARFCSGLGGDMRTRYNGLAADIAASRRN
ncbi:MAG: hypothetical protein EP335_03845 [Alphaproteobacteria bacterium]|nr:MAG: hypothetical protein EP335_03845 [Alphaproteobacteria bacterium]